MTIITNLMIFIFSIFCFNQLSKFNNSYANSWAWFVLLVGISSCFGSTAHAVHYQLGDVFFNVVFYIMNAFIKKQLSIQLSPDEIRAEAAFAKTGKRK